MDWIASFDFCFCSLTRLPRPPATDADTDDLIGTDACLFRQKSGRYTGFLQQDFGLFLAKVTLIPAKLPSPRSRILRKPEHPGLFLQRCYLTPLDISQTELAQQLGISRRRVNEIVNGQRAISADTALKLALLFHTSPMFWLEKQQLWELYRALHAE
jgi:antitoxin HigA-1